MNYNHLNMTHWSV